MFKSCKKCPSLPVVRKCCFFVPIRKGVTVFGYVNLVLSLLSFPLLIYLLVAQAHVTSPPQEHAEGHLDPLFHLTVTIVFVAIDVIMTIVLLVGAHQKKCVLLKSYLYFGLVFQVLTLALDLVYFDYREYIENLVYFLFLSLNVYLLFLVYNTVRVIEETAEVQYVSYQDRQMQL